jgi:Ser/Thr protein kinase RdoA (MazF antagonist)
VGPDVWAWSGVTLVERVTGGQRNEVWVAESPHGSVAVRRSRRSAASLAWELGLIDALDRAGFRVPVAVRTDDGASERGGVVVQRWLDGRRPSSRRRLASGRRRARAGRHGCSADVDLSALPDDAVELVLAAFRAVGDVEVSVVHGDPGPPNIRIDDDGIVGLLDWDESRVDVVLHDLSELGVRLLGDADHQRAMRLSHASEAANAWRLEPDDARNRLTQLGN